MLTSGRSMACALEPHTPLPSALQVHPKVAQELRRAELPHVQGPCDRAARAGRPRAGRRREHGRRSAAVGQHGGRAMVAHLTKPDLAGAGVGGLGGARVRGKVPGRFQAAQKRGVEVSSSLLASPLAAKPWPWGVPGRGGIRASVAYLTNGKACCRGRSYGSGTWSCARG